MGTWPPGAPEPGFQDGKTLLKPLAAHLCSLQSEGTCITFGPWGSLDSLVRGHRVRPQWAEAPRASNSHSLADRKGQSHIPETCEGPQTKDRSDLRRILENPCSLAGLGTLSLPGREGQGQDR